MTVLAGCCCVGRLLHLSIIFSLHGIEFYATRFFSILLKMSDFAAFPRNVFFTKTIHFIRRNASTPLDNWTFSNH